MTVVGVIMLAGLLYLFLRCNVVQSQWSETLIELLGWNSERELGESVSSAVLAQFDKNPTTGRCA